MTLKINSLELENVKRVSAVALEPSANGLTVIGGRNGQGKTSVLDSIAWALGGKKFQPSKPQHEGSVTPPSIKVELSNGIIVERKGKNSALKVKDSRGLKQGQKLLDELIGEMALNIPEFMNQDSKGKAKYLLSILGIEEELAKLDALEKSLSQDRLLTGRERDSKKKYYEELPSFDDVPEYLISSDVLIAKQKTILSQNFENRMLREKKKTLSRDLAYQKQKVSELKQKLAEEEQKATSMAGEYANISEQVEKLVDLSPEEVNRQIAETEEINSKVRQNLAKEKAKEDFEYYDGMYSEFNNKIEAVRKNRMALLANADMPLEGLVVEQGELIYKGQAWDNMSGSEQLMVATAIVRKLNPECGFVLMDKLEQMDVETLQEFGAWLEKEGLQVIATRVSTGGECSIIIEDGYVKNTKVEEKVEQPKPATPWGNGGF